MTDSHHKTAHLLEQVLKNQWNRIILKRMKTLCLSDWWITAGCIAQSVWNDKYGFPPDNGISDYDIFYFDPDPSWDAEDRIIKRAATLFSDLPVTVQIRNQSRVPLWYEEKFGVPFPPVRAASDGIDCFPCKTVAVGVRYDDDRFTVYAPFGVQLLLEGVLIPNPVLQIPDVYRMKVGRWQNVWPGLVAEPWAVANAS